METLRKAIDKLPVLLKAHIYEPSIDAVAEISFKAGQQDQSAFDQLNFDKERKDFWNKIEEAKLAGMREVIEWISLQGNNRPNTRYIFGRDELLNFLKEKVLK